MLTATQEPRVELARRIADLGRRCNPGVSYNFVQSCRGGVVVALVTTSRCEKD